LGNRVLNELIEDELIRQDAAAQGVSVTRENVEAKINEFFDYDPKADLTTPTPTFAPTETPTPFVSPTPTNTPTVSPTPELTATATFTPFPSATPTTTPDATQRAETFTTSRNEFYGYLRSQAGLSDDDIYRFFESLALRDALRDHVTAEQSQTAPFVNVRQIVVESQERAQEVIAALQAGESFAALAQAVSTDASNAQGGELGWRQLSSFDTTPGEAFTDAITNAEIGALVGPVQIGTSYYVVQVRGREDRELTETEFESARDAAFERYVDDLRQTNNPNIQIFDTWLDNVPENPRFVLTLS
jgi:parvulin-like peptidyl-prolyl isomerase